MAQLSKCESWGGYANFSGELLIESKWFDALSEDAKTELGFEASEMIRKIQAMIELAYAKEHKRYERDAVINSLVDIFTKVWIPISYFEVVKNEYWGNGIAGWLSPWICVHTSVGKFKIGWRKRVIVLEWNDTLITATADELFPNEDVTKIGKSIHCWGESKAVEYLGLIKEQKTPFRVEVEA